MLMWTGIVLTGLLVGLMVAAFVFRNRLMLRNKMIALGLFIGLGATLAVGSIATWRSSDALYAYESSTLAALRDSRKHQIEDYFVTIHEQMLNFSQNEMVVSATRDFATSFATVAQESELDTSDGSAVADSVRGYYASEFGPRLKEAGQTDRGASAYVPASASGRVLQSWYISNSPHPVGSKLDLERADADVAYNRFHAQYHPQMRRFLTSFGYYDIFLFDTKGNLVYSVFKETDYATNFFDGPYKDTNFGQVVRKALGAASPGQVFIEDFKPYEPSYGSPASFIASPVFDGGELIGCAVFQMPVDKINGIMQQSTGLGETGETYLVASDNRMRSNSRFSEDGESTIFTQEVKTAAVDAAFAGETGVQNVDDYQGDEALNAFAPLTFLDGEGNAVPALESSLDWAIIAEQNRAELDQPVKALALQIAIAGLVVAVFVVVGALLFAINLTRPIKALLDRSLQIAKGDLTGEPLVVKSRDEIGQVTEATNQMSDSLRELVSEMAQSADNVAAAATEIAASSEEMAAGMDSQTQQITQISSAIEEMSASVIEVARKSSDASQASSDAGKVAENGGAVVKETINGMHAINDAVNASANSVKELGQLGEQIGEVIEVINDIADQTNLLALNAAIEAARAGEHGRGFAVVADEVRKLADRTTKATEEVAQSITAIQTGTVDAVQRMETGTTQVQVGVERASEAGENLEKIVASAQNVSAMIQSIAAAAEEQSAASEEVSKNAEQIAAVAQQAGEGAGQAAAAATDLSQKAEQMRTLVGRFRIAG